MKPTLIFLILTVSCGLIGCNRIQQESLRVQEAQLKATEATNSGLANLKTELKDEMSAIKTGVNELKSKSDASTTSITAAVTTAATIQTQALLKHLNDLEGPRQVQAATTVTGVQSSFGSELSNVIDQQKKIDALVADSKKLFGVSSLEAEVEALKANNKELDKKVEEIKKRPTSIITVPTPMVPSGPILPHPDVDPAFLGPQGCWDHRPPPYRVHGITAANILMGQQIDTERHLARLGYTNRWRRSLYP